MKDFLTAAVTPTGQRLIIAGTLVGMWFCLVVLKFVPAADFIAFIRDILIGLGLYHATLKNPSQGG